LPTRVCLLFEGSVLNVVTLNLKWQNPRSFWSLERTVQVMNSHFNTLASTCQRLASLLGHFVKLPENEQLALRRKLERSNTSSGATTGARTKQKAQKAL
jgi:hypothetical protein